MAKLYPCKRCGRIFRREGSETRCPYCPWSGNWPKTSASARGYGYEWRQLREIVFATKGRRCCQCGSTQNLEVDHITPKSRGGSDTLDNLQVLCHRCHRRKTDRQGGPGRRKPKP